MSMKLEEFARESRATHKGDKSGVPIVGLEHLIPQEIKFSGYDVDTENTFTKTFKKGQILFGRRRAYLKKAAIADFDGICSGDITVIEAIPDKVDPLLLPFIIQNDKFFDYAVSRSAGGLSPRVKWEHLKDYEFDLPPIEEQRILADKLWAAYRLKESYKKLLTATQEMVKSQFIEMFGSKKPNARIADVSSVVSGKSIAKELEDIPGDVAYVKVGDFNLPENGKYILASSRYVTSDNADSSKRIPSGTVIFAKNGAASMSNKKRLTAIECCIDMNTLAVIPNPQKLDSEFLYGILDSFDLSSCVRQGAVPSISPHAIEEIEIFIPPFEEQLSFSNLCKQADKSEFELRKSIEAIDQVIKSLIN